MYFCSTLINALSFLRYWLCIHYSPKMTGDKGFALFSNSQPQSHLLNTMKITRQNAILFQFMLNKTFVIDLNWISKKTTTKVDSSYNRNTVLLIKIFQNTWIKNSPFVVVQLYQWLLNIRCEKHDWAVKFWMSFRLCCQW